MTVSDSCPTVNSTTTRVSAAKALTPVTAAAVRHGWVGWPVYPGWYTRVYTRDVHSPAYQEGHYAPHASLTMGEGG